MEDKPLARMSKKKRKRKEVEMISHIKNERMDVIVDSGEIHFFLIMRILYNIMPVNLKPR